MATKLKFDDAHLRAIADALGDTRDGLKNTEITDIFRTVRIDDPGPGTKRERLYIGFHNAQASKGDRTAILAFIRLAMAPPRHAREPARYEPMRAHLNRALAFAGLVCDQAGVLSFADAATTLPEAERRARDLRADLEGRGVHPDVLAFCRSELLVDNYFHATLEAVKSIGDKMRKRTGLTDDGAALVDRVFGGDKPMLAINALASKSEQDEQKGFVNLLKGVFGMFRNPTAHEAKVNWAMERADAEDLLTLASLIHRRIDAAVMPPRT